MQKLEIISYTNEQNSFSKLVLFSLSEKYVRYFYTACFYLLLPLAFLRLFIRSFKAPNYRQRWAERLGFVTNPPKPGGIWLHAVSVGEAFASIPLIKALKARYPDYAITVTTTTPTGSEQIKAILGDAVFHVYAPYDLPFCINRFLKTLSPRLIVIMETELWPNWLYAAHQKNIPILLANARLSPSSFKHYAYFKPFMTTLLSYIHTVAAQSTLDSERFIALGLAPEKLVITGSVKFDLELPPSITEQAQAIRQMLGVNRSILVAASTHETEEELILRAFKKILNKIPDCLLVLVPRHPERFQKVYQLCVKYGFKTIRRTDNISCDPNVQVFLGNTLGELLRFYGAADLAFVGGSFVQIGGHNILEPATLNIPIITGPIMFNFAEITELLCNARGIIKLKGNEPDELADEAVQLLSDPVKRTELVEAAQSVVSANKGSVKKHLLLVEELLQK